MRRREWFLAVAITVFMLSAPAGLSQVDPQQPPDTATEDTAPLPTEAAPADATADPLAPVESGAAASTDTAADTAGTAPLTPLGDEDLSRLKMGFELETEAWLLPLVVFVGALLMGLALHGFLVAHDVKHWPDTKGSWWKLRFWPLLLALGLLIATYFFFVRGLDEEALRIAGPRVRMWLYIYVLAVLVLWLLPRPKFPRRATTVDSVEESA